MGTRLRTRASLTGARILGIDPGTERLGYAVLGTDTETPSLLTAGAIRAPRAKLPERLRTIHAGLIRIVTEYAPTCAAVETAFAGKGPQASLRIGEARGVILLTLAEAGIPIAEYPPASVKKAVTGDGGSGKEGVRRMVCRMLGIDSIDGPADASDAAALALCHILRTRGGARAS